jgi:tetratricopeptide (TPR) repeat protein
LARSSKSNTHHRPADESASEPRLPGGIVGRWPQLFVVVLCLAIGGIVLERLSRPNEQARPENTPVAETGAKTPAPQGVSESAVRPTLEELLEEARQLAAGLEETFPQDADALNLAATIHNELFQDSDKAMDCWERALAIDPNSAEVHFNIGCSARGSGDYQKATSHFLKTHARSPEMGDVRYLLADSLLKLGEADRAIDVLQEAGDPGRYGAKGRLVLGHAYSQRGDFEAAKRHFEAALAVEPKNLQAHHGLIKVMMRLKQPEQAKKHRDAVAELEKSIRESAGADRASETAQVTRDVKYVVWWLNTFSRLAAEVYQRNGRTNAAAQLMRRAKQLRPDKP